MNKNNENQQNRVIYETDLKECISCLDFCQNQLAIGLVDEKVLILNYDLNNISNEQYSQLFRFEDNSLGVVDVKYDSDGKQLAVSCLDSCIRVYNTEEGCLFSQIQGDPMQSFKLCFNDRNIVTVGESGKINTYDIETQELIENYKTGDSFLQSIDISPNLKYISVGNCLGHVFIIDVETKNIQKLDIHGKQVRSLKFTQDNNKLITASDDLHINLIDVEKQKLILTLTGHKSNINCVDTNLVHQNLFMTCSFDKSIKLWDLNTNKTIQTINSHNDNVWVSKFSMQGNIIASGNEGGQLFIHSII